MNSRLLIWMFCALLIAGCNRKNEAIAQEKAQKESVDEADEGRMMEGPMESSSKNSHVIFKVVEVVPNKEMDMNLPHCDAQPCRALVEVMAMSMKGANYHGEYNETDKIEVQFLFTLSPTDELFPHLNEPLPGLEVGNFFEAELFVTEPGMYRVQLYDIKN